MKSVGDILRNQREAQGKTVASLAQELCITKQYLQAIEADDVASLPGDFFYKSFVRQYATLLGLDPEPLLKGARELVAASKPEPETPEARVDSDVPAQSGSVWRGVIRMPDPVLEAANKLDISDRGLGLSAIFGLVFVVLVCSSFYAWWTERQQAPPAEETPTTISTVAAQPETSSVGVTTETNPDGSQSVVLRLSATEETWLSITSDGKQIFSGILRPSETKTLVGTEEARMRVGNAGGIDVKLNGREIGPLGKRGQVRVIEFTPDDYEIVSPPRRRNSTPPANPNGRL